MYSRKKGKSGSTKPLKKTKPAWVRYGSKEVEQLVVKLAKQEVKPSQIGIILRDSYGIPDIKTITKKSITKILEENKVLPHMPEDLTSLIKKQIKITKHLEKNHKDMPSKRGLQLTESKIRRLVKYYKKTGKLPKAWVYDRNKADLLLK